MKNTFFFVFFFQQGCICISTNSSSHSAHQVVLMTLLSGMPHINVCFITINTNGIPSDHYCMHDKFLINFIRSIPCMGKLNALVRSIRASHRAKHGNVTLIAAILLTCYLSTMVNCLLKNFILFLDIGSLLGSFTVNKHTVVFWQLHTH